MRMRTVLIALVLIAGFSVAAVAQENRAIPPGSKVFVNEMGGFETYFKAALEKKKVPVVLVESKEDAEFEIVGTSESQKASTAKKVILLSWHSKEQASIQVIDVKTTEVVFAYSVHKANSARGRQSSAEACAKYLKKAIERVHR